MKVLRIRRPLFCRERESIRKIKTVEEPRRRWLFVENLWIRELKSKKQKTVLKRIQRCFRERNCGMRKLLQGK